MNSSDKKTNIKDLGLVEEISGTDLVLVSVNGKARRALASLLKGQKGDEVELRITETHIQWRMTGGEWHDLISFATLRGPIEDATDKAFFAADTAAKAAIAADTAAGSANSAASSANTAATSATNAAQSANTAAARVETAITNAQNATSAANTAAGNADAKATAANNAATLANQKAALADQKATDANNATIAANNAKDAANTAASNANTKATAADAAATSANSAANEANAKAGLASTAAGAATAAAENAQTQATDARSTIVRLEELEESLVGQYKMIPTGMNLKYPDRVTLGNTVPLRINYELLPTNTGRNVLFLGDNNAVSVMPNGEFAPQKPGISTIHVIPTENTEICKTIQITVVEPGLRKVGSSLRFMGNGNLRLT